MKILRWMFSSILVVLFPSMPLLPFVVGQYVSTAYTAAASQTNINRISGTTNMVGSGNTTVAITYTCASTSNRMVMIGDASGTGPLTITDTGGQASGATLIGGGTWSGGENYAVWNVGCSASSNTTTLHIMSGTASLILQAEEYSGIQSGGDGITVNVGSSTSCSVSATAASTGDLSVGYVGTGFAVNAVANNSPFSQIQVASVNPTPNSQFGWTFDALHQASGSLTFTATTPSAASTTRCLIANIPGTAAGSAPTFLPTMAQGPGGCTSSSPATLPMIANVTSGDILVFTFANENASTPPSSISDTLSTVYTLQVHQATGSSNGMWIYTGPATASGADTLTISGTFSFICATLVEFRGLTGTTTNTAGQGASSGTMTWAQTVSNNKSVVVACVKSFHSSTTVVPNSTGYSFAAGGIGADSMSCSYTRVLTSGTQNPSFAVSTTDSNVGASIVLQ